MALFNLTDIKFKKDKRGPLNPLVSSEYTYNTLKYPLDLGTYDKGHYMVIYINQQVNTQYPRTEASDSRATIASSLEAIQSQRGPVNLGQITGVFANQIQSLLGTSSRAISSAASATNLFSNEKSSKDLLGVLESFGDKAAEEKNKVADILGEGAFVRKIKRTTDAIALYMPDTLNFTYSQTYSDAAIFDNLGLLGTAAAAGASIVDSSKGANAPKQSNISSFLLQAIKDIGGTAGTIGNIGLAALGVASNPGLELLYTSPSFRKFRFDFLLYPRSQQEAKEVYNIINRLKFHQAPEIASRSGGRFLIPPSEFDIKFYYNGVENPNIPRMSTCVLDTIDVDYAPNGFAAYEVPSNNFPTEGGTGMPVAIRLSLNFTETQIITKEFLNGAENLNGSGRDTDFKPSLDVTDIEWYK